MRVKSTSKPYTIVLKFPLETTRSVVVVAASREAAERRALKHNRGAIGVVKPNAR